MTAETLDNPRSVAIESISSQEPRGSVGRGLIAGVGASVWTALVGLAVIPFYVRYLGLEGYGLIGFLATAQASLQLLDFGLSNTVSREAARGTATGEQVQARVLLHTAAIVYWITAAAIGAVMAIAAPAIASRWLQADTLGTASVTSAVALMGLVIACRWPGPLYHGALMGMQRVALSSLLNAAAVTLASGGAVLLMAFVSPSMKAYLLWQAAVGFGFVLIARAFAWRALGRGGPRAALAQLSSVWRFAAGMSAIGVVGVLLTQVDKILLSKLLPLADYGAYMLATAIAATLYLFALPFFNVLYPRFSLLAHAGNVVGLTETYRLATRLLAAMAFPAAMLLSVFARELVQAWTGDAALAARVALLLPLLAAGVALHCVLYVPYALQLAHGMTRLSLIMSLAMLAVALPLVAGLALTHGAAGGAAAVLVVQAFGLLGGGWMTHRALLKDLWGRWFGIDIGVPLILSLAAGAAAWQLAPEAGAAAVRVAVGVGWAFAAFALSVALSPALRASFLQYARDFAHRGSSLPRHD
jgi:O-antigen/teichoic acid export membrane protein